MADEQVTLKIKVLGKPIWMRVFVVREILYRP